MLFAHSRNHYLTMGYTHNTILSICLSVLYFIPFNTSASILDIAAPETLVNSGIVDALVEDFNKLNPQIEVMIHAHGAIKVMEMADAGEVDLVLSHYPKGEKVFINKGLSKYSAEIMYNDFVIFGPDDYRSEIADILSLKQLLQTLSEQSADFILPHPRSGTAQRLKDLLLLSGINSGWEGLHSSGTTVKSTLLAADQEELFTFADIGTYLVNKRHLKGGIVPLFREDVALQNRVSVIVLNENKYPDTNTEDAVYFWNYLIGDRAQLLIKSFTVKDVNSTIFTPIAHLDSNVIALKEIKRSIIYRDKIFYETLTWSIILLFILALSIVYWRKTTEKKLQKTKLDLQEATEFINVIFSSMIEPLVMINEQGNIRAYNAAMTHIMEVDDKYLLEKPINAFCSAVEDEDIFNYTITTNKNTSIPVCISKSKFFLPNDEPCELWLMHDVREVLENIHAVKQANESKDEFLASMSHELRTPLTSIIGNSELIAEKVDDPEIRNLIRSVEMAGRGQLTLVNDILDMSKIESGNFTIDAHPYNISALLQDVKQMLATRARDSGLELRVKQNNDEKYLLLGDQQRIRQILINLIGNAIKFTESGTVSLTSHSENERLFFTIKDSGIGMSPQTLDKLFQRFEQADGSISRRFGGSGLGLYISHNLAEMMEGTIDVSSELGVGSVFQLTLPHRPTDIAIHPDHANRLPPSVAGRQFSGHVLIAEDTLELQLLERRILEKMGLTVTTANNGKEAIKLATEHPFNLILMDMQMPEIDGIEATKILRSQGNLIPIVALTANVMQKHRELFHQAGCNGFLAKPIDKGELSRVLEQFMNN